MLEYEQYKQELLGLEKSINDLEASLDIAGKNEKIAELEKEAGAQDFWDDMENSQKVLQKTKQLKDKVSAYESLKTAWEEAIVLIDLANEENDETMLSEIKKTVAEITENVEKMTLETLLSGNYDRCNAIMTFHAGAGGTEAQDWVEMLMRMYQMYAQKNG